MSPTACSLVYLRELAIQGGGIMHYDELYDEKDYRFCFMPSYRGAIDYDHLEFLTHDTLKEELSWVAYAKACHGCGTMQPDCDLTWEIDEEILRYAQLRNDRDLRIYCRPRRWLCAFDVKTGAARVLCPSCYRFVMFDCVEGVWNDEFMCPGHLQMILPFY